MLIKKIRCDVEVKNSRRKKTNIPKPNAVATWLGAKFPDRNGLDSVLFMTVFPKGYFKNTF